jgi:hypothetical protein
VGVLERENGEGDDGVMKANCQGGQRWKETDVQWL